MYGVGSPAWNRARTAAGSLESRAGREAEGEQMDSGRSPGAGRHQEPCSLSITFVLDIIILMGC